MQSAVNEMTQSQSSANPVLADYRSDDSLLVDESKLFRDSVKLKPPKSQSLPWRPTCMTVPELRFELLDRPRVVAVVRVESLRRERRAGRHSVGDDEMGDR